MWKVYFLILTVSAVLVLGQDTDECSGRPPHPRRKCCSKPAVVEKSKFKECRPKFEPGTPRNASSFECPDDCIFKGANLVKDEKIDLEAVKKYMASRIGGNASWTGVVDKAIKECANKTELLQPRAHFSCKVPVMPMMMCVDFYLFRECPADMWSSDERCTEFKEYIKKCSAGPSRGRGGPGGPGGPKPGGPGGPWGPGGRRGGRGRPGSNEDSDEE